MSDWIELKEEGEFFSNKFPADETIVEVKLADGKIIPAWFGSNIMEAGDWDFAPIDGNDEPVDESVADLVVAWRPLRTKESSHG